MLRPLDKRAILFRMLSNLKAIYARADDPARAIRTIDLMLLVDPAQVVEYRDRGLLRFHAADFKSARADLEHYLDVRPDAEDAGGIRKQLALIDRLDTMKN